MKDRTFFVWALLAIFYGPGAVAEPWLSTRFAQNCSGCHAPGRRNLPPKDRRCSLSCQGCHVNPNGGGLRSYYGQWNENRVLRSFRLQALRQPLRHAPFRRQDYGKKPLKRVPQGMIKRARVKPHTLRELPPGKKAPEKAYDRHSDKYYTLTSRSRGEFEYSIPAGDPYRLMKEEKLNGGGDFRLMSYKRTNGDDRKLYTWMMEMNLGLQYRPMPHVHFVYESRFFGSPVGYRGDLAPGTEQTRSFYGMVDDLPWNIFVMAGYYKPLFGNYVADHTALSARMISSASTGIANGTKLLYKAISVGAAPNVPYLNVHYIAKRVGTFINESEKGFAANAGLRFVSYGASLNYSFWSTSDDSNPDSVVKVEMHSFHAAATKYRVLLSAEALILSRDDPAKSFDRGAVTAIEARYRLWRENYLTGAWSIANTDQSLQAGSGQQIKYGLRSFIIPGLDVTLQMSQDRQETKATDTKTDIDAMSMLVHVFF